jgi:hypothetical protein
MVVLAEFVRVDDDGREHIISVPFRAKTFTITLDQIYFAQVAKAQQDIEANADSFLEKGSGWILNAVYRTDLEVAKCRPLAGSCGDAVLSIETLGDVKSLTNSTDGDHRCFFYAVARYFVGSDDIIAIKRFVADHLNIVNIPVPVSIRHIAKFEEMNSHLSMSINILYKEGATIYPLRVNRTPDQKLNYINILLHQYLFQGVIVRHYTHINNLGKILRKEYEYNVKDVNLRMKYRHKTRRSYEKLFVCPNCLAKFSRDHTLAAHFTLCRQNEELRIEVPQPGDEIRFKDWTHKFKVPLVGFFDFEAVQTEPDSPCLTCTDADLLQCYHKTSVESVQQAGTFSLVIINHLGVVIYSRTYSGDDAAEVLLDTLLSIEPSLTEQLEIHEPMILSFREQLQFETALECHICEKAFEEGDKRCRDHCHLTGAYLGAAHNTCNLKRVDVRKVPLFAHNFTSYDSHLVVRALRADPRIKSLRALPRNTEKFRTFEMNIYRFLDSMSFLDGSLANIVSDLVLSGHQFPLIDQAPDLCRNSEEKLLLLEKGQYPYEWATSVEQLKNATELPPHEEFFSKVANSNISERDYAHAKKVFDTFQCQNMLEYT